MGDVRERIEHTVGRKGGEGDKAERHRLDTRVDQTTQGE